MMCIAISVSYSLSLHRLHYLLVSACDLPNRPSYIYMYVHVCCTTADRVEPRDAVPFDATAAVSISSSIRRTLLLLLLLLLVWWRRLRALSSSVTQSDTMRTTRKTRVSFLSRRLDYTSLSLSPSLARVGIKAER